MTTKTPAAKKTAAKDKPAMRKPAAGKTAEKKPTAPDTVEKLLMGAHSDDVAKQLPPGVDADRFIRTTLTVVRMNTDLLLCTPTSLFGAIMSAAKDGLLPDGKESMLSARTVLISKPNVAPKRYERRAQYMPMVKGLIQIMYRTGEVLMVDGVAVYEKDQFEYERGDSPRIIHKPYAGEEENNKVVAAYVVIKMKSGEVKREVMFRRDLEAVRAESGDPSSWEKFYDQYAIKTVIKRAYKQLPTDGADAFEHVISADNEAMGFNFDQRQAATDARSDLRATAEPGKPSRLKAIIGSKAAPEESGQAQTSDVPFND